MQTPRPAAVARTFCDTSGSGDFDFDFDFGARAPQPQRRSITTAH